MINIPTFSGIHSIQNKSENNNAPFNDEAVELAAYSDKTEQTGINIAITQHQSINNTGDPLYEIVDFNSLANRSFEVDCPADSDFNSSSTLIEVKDIYAPNKTLNLETGTTLEQTMLDGRFYGFSFTILSNCTLNNFSLCLGEDENFFDTQVSVDIYNAEYDSGEDKMRPKQTLSLYSKTQSIPMGTSKNWYNFIVNKDLNTGMTDNKTFFIILWKSGADTGVPEFCYETDPVDNLLVWRRVSPNPWSLGNLLTIDASFKIQLSLADDTPRPEDINMTIEGQKVDNIGAGNEGSWSSINGEFTDPSGQLNFTIDADWWDVTCNITKFQVNYTKTSVYGIANFTATTTDNSVYWNVTMSDFINDFEGKFENPYINFTIPAHWQNVEVWNGDTQQIISTTRSLGTGYNQSQVLNAANGNFWFLNATTSNLISETQGILTYVSGSDVDMINYTDTIDINANFSINIANNDGDFNLSVYNHNPPRYLNHTRDLTTFTGGTEINVDNWIVANNVTEYGEFRVQLLWNNGTDAGFREKTITILGETEIISSIPIGKTTFDANENFNITVLYNDTGMEEGIFTNNLNYSIGGSAFRGDNIEYIGNGEYNITIYCNDAEFGGYGSKSIVINANKTYYHNQTDTVNIEIIANTNLQILEGAGPANYDSNEIFNITIEYNDTVLDQGIITNHINYSIDGNAIRGDNVKYIGDGQYNITIYCNDTEFGNYGEKSILIHANKTNYHNWTVETEYNITGVTSISKDIYPMKSFYYSEETFNITVTFSDISRTNPEIDNADIEYQLDTGQPFTSAVPIGNGQYNITINCSDVYFKTSNYGWFTIDINANKTYYENQTDSLNVLIIGQTSFAVSEPLGTPIYLKGQIFNITVQYTDTEKPEGITGATIEYRLDEGAPYLNTDWEDIGGGRYNITVFVDHINFTSYGLKTIIINVSKQNYNNRSIQFSFDRRITTEITPFDTYNTYTLDDVVKFNNISFTFNYSDTVGKSIDQATWNVIDGYNFISSLENVGNGNYTIHLNTSQVSVLGSPYNFRFNITAPGNETQEITLIINVILRQTIISNVTYITSVPYSAVNLTIRFNYNDTLTKAPLIGLNPSNISLVNVGIAIGFTWWIFDLGNGTYVLNLSLSGLSQDEYTLNLTVYWTNDYNSSYTFITFTYGTIPGLPSDGGGGGGGGGGTRVTGIPFETLILYIIIVAAIGGGVGAIAGIQKGVIAPKKREKERILREVTTIFDDAINLEHILVIYKTSGTCVFFKSYGMEEIDPELISGFLSAVSSFGREMDSQEALNEIQYGDKMLLLADGEYIRIALVLNKQASIILRQHLKEFIELYEEKYGSSLPNWRGQLADFRDSGELIDRVFSTSIILPHQVNYDAGKIKELKVPHSKDVLKVANALIEDSDKRYFFIATLLVEATDKTGKEKAEVFMGIKELRDANILTPIQITAIEKPPITQQELELIRQQVCDLPGLTEEEIDDITNNLAQMGPTEREAYLASCREQAAVVSAPIKTKAETGMIDNVKTAKKEIKNLKKLANTALKGKDTQRAIEIYNNAIVIATNWDLTKEFEELEDIVRITTINELKAKMKVLESEAKVAAKAGDYAEATQKYDLAARAASEIFKLGITEMTKEVKRLTNKSREYEKLS